MKQILQRILFSLLLVAFTIGQGFSQVSVTTANFIYLQDFNSFNGNNINTVPQWMAGGSFTYRGLGNGSSNSGGAWAYGIGAERALGFLGSNTSSSISYSVSFVNNTGSAITQLEISYDFEQWRYETGNTIGWTVFGTGALSSTSLAGLNSSSVNVGVNGTVQVTPKSIVLTGLNLLPNATFGVQLSSGNGAGNDNGIAIDNFRLALVCAPNIVSVDTTLCAGGSFVLNGNTYTTNQIVSDTLLAANGCDSIVNYNLNFLPAIISSFTDTICAGTTYNWGSQMLTTTGTYNQTFVSTTNCDSIVTLNLFVRPAITNIIADTICAASTYTWGSQMLTTTGTYNQIFTSATNCDSIVALNLFVRPAITNVIADTICAASTYTWGSQMLTTTGTYNQTFVSTTNCDSIVTLNLFVRPAITNIIADTICAASTYTWGGQMFTTTGTYNQTFVSTTNCDSIVTLNLFVRPAITNVITDTVCAALTYTWGSQMLTTTGTYNQTFTSVTNCDSIVTLNLFVRPAITNVIADTICAGITYTWGSQILTTTGTYNQTFASTTNCDSIVALNLFVRPAITNVIADTICAASTYTWGSQMLTTTGTYNQTFASTTNCDSIVALNLFVRPAIIYAFSDTICAGITYTWGSQSLATSGSYNQTFTSTTNCDSIVALNLFVRPAITNVIADTICAASTYTWGSQMLTTTGTYNQTFASTTNCDSIVALNLFVRPAIIYAFSDTICAGITYTWGSQSLATSGSYNQTFTSATSCDSIVTLNLMVNPAITNTIADTICAGTTYNWGSQSLITGGTYNQTFVSATNCDSIVTLNLFVHPVITNVIADTICAASTYTWGGQSLTTTGTYNQTFTSATNCDSIVTLNLQVNPVITNAFADTICAGTTYNWGSQTLTTAGTYNQTFTSIANCDSIVTLNLFVRPANSTTDNRSICAGTSYTFGSQVLTMSGTYSEIFQNIYGCDSTVTLTLNVGSAITNTITASICSGSTYTWGSQSLTASGSYNQTFTSATNCDSIVTLNLMVNPAITNTIADTICAATTYNWGGQTFTAAGAYNQTFISSTNCDSTVTLNLFVRPTITYAFADTTCSGTTYNWGSQNLTTSGAYNQTFTSFTNCDSIVILNLFVRPSNNTTDNRSICAGTSYAFGTQVLTMSGTYSEIFQNIYSCDSTVTLTLNVNPAITNTIAATLCYGAVYNWGTQVLNTSGVYTQTFTASSSCDSIVTLSLTVNPLLTDTLDETLCFGQTFTLGGQVLNTSGTYSQVFPAANGCDSLVILHLTMHPLLSDTVSASICYGGTYPFGSQNLSVQGYYSETFTSVTGCDSTITLNLQVSPQPVTVTIDTADCGTVWFEGISYTSSTTLTDTFPTALGCDSIYRVVNINPHPNNPVVQVTDTASCGPLVFEGNLYTESITLSDTIFNQLGCDSIVRTINIAIHNPETQTISHEMCAGSSFTFNGQQYTTAGSYPFTFKNQAGCDSIVVLELKINSLPDIEIIKDNKSSYCIGDSVILQASGAQRYTWIYADIDTLEGEYFNTILFNYKNAFSLAGIDNNGCQNTASIHIDAQACCNIWMPNAFSPNADGMNDLFKPEAQGHPKEYVMYIYNRWGQTVFSTFNIAQGWDGNINGKPADIADYYYHISGKCVNGETINLKGICTLIR